MNQTSATGNSAGPIGDTTALLTTVHLAWLAVFAVLVVIGILYGMRIKHRRVAAERRAAEHSREAGVASAPTAEAEPAPAAAEPDPADPVAGDRAGPAPASTDRAAPPPPPATADAANGSVNQLKGLGPKVAARLAELGITTVGQIAALDHDAAQALDERLGPFSGRLERDRWVEQARFLAAGDRAGFEAVFGKL